MCADALAVMFLADFLGRSVILHQEGTDAAIELLSLPAARGHWRYGAASENLYGQELAMFFFYVSQCTVPQVYYSIFCSLQQIVTYLYVDAVVLWTGLKYRGISHKQCGGGFSLKLFKIPYVMSQWAGSLYTRSSYLIVIITINFSSVGVGSGHFSAPPHPTLCKWHSPD